MEDHALRSSRDYYRILNVPRTAGHEEIKQAYRRLVLLLHPDKKPSSSAPPPYADAEEASQLQNVIEAWNVLGDVEKKAVYDACCAVSELPIAAEVDLSEMSFDEESDTYSFACRCGDVYRASIAQLVQGIDTVPCGGCSFAIKILYETEEEENGQEKEGSEVEVDQELRSNQAGGTPADSALSHLSDAHTPFGNSLFALLPEEQGLEIFTYLDYQDLCRVSCVCKTFLRWASDDCLWRPLYTRHLLKLNSVRGMRGIFQTTPLVPAANGRESWRSAFRERACREREAEDIIEARNKQIVLLERRIREFESEVKNIFDYLEGEKQAQLQTSAMLMKARAELENAYYEVNEKDKRLEENDSQVMQLTTEVKELTELLHTEKKKSSLLEKQQESAQQASKKAEEELELMQQRWASAVQDNFRLKKENMALLKELTAKAGGGEVAKQSIGPRRTDKTATSGDVKRQPGVPIKGRLPFVPEKAKCNF